MKFRVQFKDPDGVYDSIQDAAREAVEKIKDLDEDEIEALIEKKVEKLRDFTGKWFRYGEYVTIEFDTKAGTAVVVEDES